MENRKGNWITTYSGNKFYPLDVRPEDILIEDIAHALSQICRFGGQCKNFYSVAQHSINVYLDLKENGYNEEIQLFGLLHDGSEAYIGDIPTPIKYKLSEYLEIEDPIQNLIFSSFHLPTYNEEIHKIIKESDKSIFYNEAIRLMKDTNNWISNNEYRKINIDTSFQNMEEVKNEFLDIAKILTKKK